MAEMSRRFNFDDFDRQIAEALEEHERLRLDSQMAREGIELEEELAWADHDRRPGEIGSVPVRLTTEIKEEPL